MSLVRIAQSREQVPRGGNRQKDEQAGYEAQFAPTPPQAGEQQVRNDRGEEKHRGDQSLSQNGEGQRSIAKIESAGPAVFEPGEEAVERKRNQHAQNGFWNVDP